jgi:hypothetical protein
VVGEGLFPLDGLREPRPASEEMRQMPKVSKASAAHVDDLGVAEDRHDDIGGYTVDFATVREDMDLAPRFKGLPDDRCQCPHWGYVFAGSITVSYGDYEEVIGAGEAFYLPPGHVPFVAAGTEFVQFSPTEEAEATAAAIARNMHTGQAG